MAQEKRSFFERLTGAVRVPEDDDELDFDADHDMRVTRTNRDTRSDRIDHVMPASVSREETQNEWIEESSEEGQLTVDVYQTSTDIVIKSIVAGVRPEDLDISISRDMVTIRGKRDESKEANDDEYFHKELYWGAFSRTILLPEEIDVEAAEANEKHGLLTIRLPKIDKRRQTKLKVRGS